MLSSKNQRIAKAVVLLAIVPMIFACSKSKFSASKQEAVKKTNNTLPKPPPKIQEPARPINDGSDNDVCTVNCGPAPAPVPVPVPVPRPKPPREVPPPPKVDCQEYVVKPPQYNGPRAMNVWVVMDASKSNAKERYSQLVALIDMYEKNIARQMPITLAVITGHSPESNDSAMKGSPFYLHSNEARVLKFGGGRKDRKQMLKALERKILDMRTDNSRGVSDGGELLTVNLLATLRKAEAYSYIRKGDLLNIHFIGDENDICTIGQVPDYDKIKTSNGKTISREEYSRGKNCKHMNVTSGGNGFSQTLLDELSEVNKAFRVQLTGFVYTTESTVPRNGAKDENEVARGIVDLIEQTGGHAYDLAQLNGKQSFEAASSTLANHINQKENLVASYQIKGKDGSVVDLNKVDPKSIQVYVDNQGMAFRTNSSQNAIELPTSPIDAKKVKIRYCNE